MGLIERMSGKPIYARLKDVDGHLTNKIIVVMSDINEDESNVSDVFLIYGYTGISKREYSAKKDSFEITNEFDGVEGGEYLQEVLKQAEGVPHMMTVPKGGARKANKAKKSRKSRKSRKARKSRKSRKARKTRKH